MRSKNTKLPKYVYRQDIKGKTYYRFRRKGAPAIRLPGDPGSPAFHAAYAKLLTAIPKDIGRYNPGSVAHTIHLYRQSAQFGELSGGTKRDYRRYLDRLDRSIGGRPIASITEEYAFALLDRLKGTPGAANHAISVGRTLFGFAVKRKIVSQNPFCGLERLKGGDGFERWPEEAIAAFRRLPDSMMVLALDIGLYTGQRLSDVIAMAWSNYDGQRIKVKQQKTGVRLTIPVHPDLKAVLDRTPRRGLMVLTSKTGLAFHSRVFSRDFRNARIAAGLQDGLSYHGLRHTAASHLAEAGASAPEIMAITGHKSLKQVEHYIRQARQEVQAENAISRLPNRKSAKLNSKPVAN